jgi:hypothetical protein
MVPVTVVVVHLAVAALAPHLAVPPVSCLLVVTAMRTVAVIDATATALAALLTTVIVMRRMFGIVKSLVSVTRTATVREMVSVRVSAKLSATSVTSSRTVQTATTTRVSFPGFQIHVPLAYDLPPEHDEPPPQHDDLDTAE